MCAGVAAVEAGHLPLCPWASCPFEKVLLQSTSAQAQAHLQLWESLTCDLLLEAQPLQRPWASGLVWFRRVK